jgi:isoquinoline 1-oxidoreductase alpha subunit
MRLMVNGKAHDIDLDSDTPLLWALRDELGLTGTKFGCGMAQCGACTVHVDGMPRRSCVTPISTLEGKEVVTIEGVTGKEAEAVQKAWVALDVPQCGYCQSGQIMSAIALLSMEPKPDDKAIDEGMAGNLCRCATYVKIRAAIHAAAKAMEG